MGNLIPDVMTGVAEMITALTPPGSAIVISPPVYAPFSSGSGSLAAGSSSSRWPGCTALARPRHDPAATFLDRGRVALSPGPDFGTQGNGFARLNMGTSPELLGEAVRRMSAVRHHPR